MKQSTVLIMAGGTGGHIFPALSIARSLQARDVAVHWLGTENGMEVGIVGGEDIPLHLVPVHGLRGKGVIGLVLAPWMVVRATVAASRILRQLRPDCVLGMGGYVTGPGGLAAWLQRRPLLIHEQNAVPGLSNRLLARLADRILEGFPGSFADRHRAICTGTPVAATIEAANEQRERPVATGSPLRVLVLGGSQGAAALNQVLPGALALLPASQRPALLHQCGQRNLLATRHAYEQAGITLDDDKRVIPFIEDMAAAYAWADVVICRAGAATVSEVAAAGVPSVLVPYPHAVDDHQRRNAEWLSKAGAALLVDQRELSAEKLVELLLGPLNNHDMLRGMADAARAVARPGAAARVADICMEACR